MTLDQKIALFNAFGAWAAAIATVAAVIVSLLLATRAAKVKLKFGVGLFLIFLGDGTKPTQELIFKVTNLGDRPVTVNGVGWVIGSRWRKRKRRHAYQLLHSPNSAQPPTQLNHGDSAAFSVSLALTPDWAINLGRDLVQDVRDAGAGLYDRRTNR